MKRFIEGECRAQSTLLPERLDDWIAEDNPVRAVDAFVDELDLAKLGFEGANQRRRVARPITRRCC
jgi:transposase